MNTHTGRIGSADRATRPTAQAPAGLGDTASVPCADCADGLFPQYGVAPHECFWRKGPQFTLGQSTLVPFDETACFVPDLEDGEGWADFRYPQACGVYFCPRCHADEYQAKWDALIARIGEPPEDVATCSHQVPA